MAKFASRSVPAVGGAVPLGVAADGLVSERYPALWEYLTLVVWEDAKPRQVSTLLLFTEDGVWKGCVNDRDGQRALWMAGSDPISLLDSLEAALTAGTAVWRKLPPRALGRGQK